jgi:hypothetical protein
MASLDRVWSKGCSSPLLSLGTELGQAIALEWGMSEVKLVIALSLAAAMYASQTATEDVQEIIRKSIAATEANWKEAPHYGFVERHVESKKDGPKIVRTYQVQMIQESPYKKLLAVNDQPLSKMEEQAENRKLQETIRGRKKESAPELSRRTNAYRSERDHDHALVREMIAAFDYKLVCETKVDGRDVYQLAATPKAGYVPHDRDAKVLTGMKGTLWVDKETYQWVKLEAQVTRPVSFYGFLANVGPGTQFDLEQEPVAAGLWMPRHFSTRVYALALGFINQNSTDDRTYRDYQLLKDQ